MFASEKFIKYVLKLNILILLISLSPKDSFATELLMVTSPTCSWCELWDKEVGIIYKRTDSGKLAPIQRLNITSFKKRSFEVMRPVTYTPTFILVQNRQEIGRITGYSGEDHFWGLLNKLLQKLPNSAGNKCPENQNKNTKTVKTLGKKMC